MNFALDILLVCIVIVFVIVGVKRGFIKSAAHFLGAIAAACLSAALGGMAAQWLYDTLFHEALVEKISGTIGSMGTAEAVRNVLGSLPDFIIRALEDAGITEAALKGGVASQTGQTAELLAASLEPVFVGFLKVLTVIALFGPSVSVGRAGRLEGVPAHAQFRHAAADRELASAVCRRRYVCRGESFNGNVPLKGRCLFMKKEKVRSL